MRQQQLQVLRAILVQQLQVLGHLLDREFAGLGQAYAVPGAIGQLDRAHL